jgi:hypothetical protein
MNVRRTDATLVLAVAGPPLVAIARKFTFGDSDNILRFLPFDLLLEGAGHNG